MVHTEQKTLLTKRSFTYSYLFAAPLDSGKPTLFFAHGFPSTSHIWRRQVDFFGSKGYGLIVPDMLGYGGTSKPTDPLAYIGSGLAADIVDILDSEGVETVIAISHDWGTRLASRLINHHPHRVSASAFLAVGYQPPYPAGADWISLSPTLAQLAGYDIAAYMRWFVTDEAARLIDSEEEGEDRIDSFISLMYPSDSLMWRDTNMCVKDGAREWILQNKTTTLAPWMTPEELSYHRKYLKEGGLAAPLCWYKVLPTEQSAADDAKVISSKVTIPILFIGFTRDYVSRPEYAASAHSDPAKVDPANVTTTEVDADHWGIESHSKEVNGIIMEWLGQL